MCGICGIVGRHPVDREALARMTGALTHRGPDDEGFHVDEYEDGTAVGLGFRRLSIIDLAGGHQPLSNEDRTIWLVFNGEIYNYRELRGRLEARGHRFTTNADTEVIVHLYEDEGAACVDRLNGMFAFALWDERRRELLLARDRFGKKPLYYAERDGQLLFGSELKSLLESPACPRELDFDALTRYLALEYVPAPYSIFAGVRKLPGGHVLTWRDGRSSVSRYWELPFADADDGRSDEEYVEEFRFLLGEAVRRRLMSDVPLGAFLSGGIDSSSIVALMADSMPAGLVKTFSIGFEERSFDESEHARRVAAHFGTEHHEQVFTPGVLLDLLPEVFGHLDEPFGDASVLPTYLLSRFTRESVTVALGGDGSDELLAGYPTFQADLIARLYRPPRAVHERAIVPLVERLPISSANFSTEFKLKRFLRAAAAPADVRHAIWLGSFSPDEQAALLTRPPGDPLAEQRQAYARTRGVDQLHRLISAYATTYLQDDILVKVDRASMACSLEVRAPFLDRDLVEFLGRVPARLKLRRLETKHLLKRAMAPMLPPGIAGRGKKGFGVPVGTWFRRDLREALQDELAADRLRRQGIFEPAEVQRLVAEHLSGRRDHRKALWTLFAFQLWYGRWLEGGRSTAAAAAQPAASR
jgi:asparagine synthase (glutamine-hydrolysing)